MPRYFKGELLKYEHQYVVMAYYDNDEAIVMDGNNNLLDVKTKDLIKFKPDKEIQANYFPVQMDIVMGFEDKRIYSKMGPPFAHMIEELFLLWCKSAIKRSFKEIKTPLDAIEEINIDINNEELIVQYKNSLYVRKVDYKPYIKEQKKEKFVKELKKG